MKKNRSISVIIPTRNRLASLNRTLNSIANQSQLPEEIIIIDASDPPLKKEQLLTSANLQNVQIIHSEPSVCRQRNIGIERCTSEYILLCDDDIELSENYCQTLCAFLEANPNETIASGLVLENDRGHWHYTEKVASTARLLLAAAFGLSVGFDAEGSEKKGNYLAKKLIGYYKKKGNRIAKSGWPLIVNFEKPYFQAPIYGLGASLIRSSALKKTLFDEAFYANGIGDNYDLAISLDAPINVLNAPKAYHHREKTNRLEHKKAYYYRINALHYILLKHKRFGRANLAYFIWSLFGKSIEFLCRAKFKFVSYNLEVMFRVLLGKPLYKVKN